MSNHFKTEKPQISDATIARIRAAAHRYVLAGGSMFPNEHDADRDEHIGNVDRELTDGESSAAFTDLLHETVEDFETHEKLYSAAWSAISAHAEAAFLFGAFVGLETAALTFANLTTIPTMAATRAEKGGRR